MIVNLVSALKALTARYGDDFVLTMAPETFFVQNGYQFYGSGPWGGQDPRCGAYLPVIHALRDDLTLLHVQHYNSGPIMGLDDQYHSMGGADFHVALTDMLLTGFPVARDTTKMFPRSAPTRSRSACRPARRRATATPRPRRSPRPWTASRRARAAGRTDPRALAGARAS